MLEKSILSFATGQEGDPRQEYLNPYSTQHKDPALQQKSLCVLNIPTTVNTGIQTKWINVGKPHLIFHLHHNDVISMRSMKGSHTEKASDYLLCTEPWWWLEALGGLILLLGGTISTFWPLLSPGLWLGAWDSAWGSRCGTAAVKGFCLLRIPSLPALISFSPTLSILARPAVVSVPGHSLLGEGSLDPTPAEGGRANLEALDILQVSGSVTLLSLPQPVWLQMCPVGNPGFLSSQRMQLSNSSMLWLEQVGWEGQK